MSLYPSIVFRFALSVSISVAIKLLLLLCELSCKILYWANVLKWKWISARKTDDVKALEWNSYQKSTIWCIGLPLAKVSINIRASRSIESTIISGDSYFLRVISYIKVIYSQCKCYKKKKKFWRVFLSFIEISTFF